MYLTDDPQPHYGRLAPLDPRGRKRIYFSESFSVDGDTATQLINLGYPMAMYEQFIDSIEGQAMCFAGIEGMQDAFRAWVKERSS